MQYPGMEELEKVKLVSGGKIVVGYDISDKYAQISYWTPMSENVETVSSVAGSEVYSIPTVLCKREDANQWLYGKEALRYAQNNQGILIENLFSLALDGEIVQIEGKSFQPEALLTLFFKRSLGMLAQIAPIEKIGALMITCKKLDGRTLEVLGQVVAGLGLKTDKIMFQSHVESFYHYMLYQSEELRYYKTLLCEYRDSSIQIYSMECNKKTTPIVVHIEENSYPFTSYESLMGRDDRWERMDEEFLELLQRVCQGQDISAIYLIGDGFSEEWMKESLRFLCKNRRVFLGNNLFSKGACYGMLERLIPSENGKNYAFLGEDKLKVNVGMKILRRGQDSYFALLDAGVNWYEAENVTEFYLQEGKCVELMLTSLIGGKNKLAEIRLEGLAEGAARLRMRLHLKDERQLAVEIEDLGFGAIRPATHNVWQEMIEL